MQQITSAILTITLLASTISPVLAGPHDKSSGQAPASAKQSAPTARADAHAQRTVQAAPVQAPQRVAPQPRFMPQVQPRVERQVQQAAPIRAERAQRFTATPQRQLNEAPQQRFERVAPQQRFERAAPQQRFERAAPQQRFERAAPQQRFERFAGQQRRVEQFSPRVQRNVETFSEPVRVRNENESVAPFVQVIQPRHSRAEAQDVETAVPVVAYQPTVLTGEVVNVDNDDVFLQTPSGQVETIVMEGHGRHHGWWHHIMAIPVIETNGVFYAQPNAFVQGVPTSYVYPSSIYTSSFVPMTAYDPYAGYGSPYGYSNGNIVSSLLTATLASYVVSYLMGSHPSLSSIASSVLPAVAASALGGGSPYGYPPGYGYTPSSYLAPAYAPTYVAPAYTTSYVAPAAYNPVTGYGYPTTCVYTDPVTGLTSYDPACAPATTTSYYTSPNVYTPEQLQGVVVGVSGSTLMVLGANGLTPILVNDAPAIQSGNLFNGQPTTGRVVTAYGFYSGSTFVATALQ